MPYAIIRPMRPLRKVLLLTSTRLHLWYPELVAFARSNRWALSVVERYNPPRNWQGDGVLAMQLELPDMRPTARWIARRSLPVVNISDTWAQCPHPTFGTDLSAAIRLATRHLRETGYRNLAVYASGSNPAYDEFLRQARESWTGQPPDDWIFRHGQKDGTLPSVHEHDRLLRHLKSAPKPIAVLAFNDYLAAQVEDACLELGLPVPSDVAIVGLSGIPIYSELAPIPITTVVPDRARIIRKAAEALDAIMDGKRIASTVTSIPPKELVIRQSTDGIAIQDAELRAAFRDATADLSVPFNFPAASPNNRIRLNRKAQEEFGLSFKALVLNAKLHHARTLLVTTNDKIDSIARDCSFCNASYFIKTFVEQFGLTPSEYRRHIKKPFPSGSSHLQRRYRRDR